jgi:peptidyl-prolyl cis-trans isomerase C
MMAKSAVQGFVFLVFATGFVVACGPEPRATENARLVAAGPVVVPEGDQIAARVNDTVILRTDVWREAQAQFGDTAGLPPELSDEDFDAIVEQLIDQRLLALEARRLDLHRTPEARRQLALAEERILGNVLVETTLENAVTEETIQRIYSEQIRLIPRGIEVRARHIMVASREEADAVKARLEAGEDFAELAVAISQDNATRLEGGDMGYFSRQGILPAFGAVAFATDEGAISEPFQSEFGWHVLTVVDRRQQPPPPLETLRANIVRYYTFDQLETLIVDLRSSATVERFAMEEATELDLAETGEASDVETGTTPD